MEAVSRNVPDPERQSATEQRVGSGGKHFRGESQDPIAVLRVVAFGDRTTWVTHKSQEVVGGGRQGDCIRRLIAHGRGSTREWSQTSAGVPPIKIFRLVAASHEQFALP